MEQGFFHSGIAGISRGARDKAGAPTFPFTAALAHSLPGKLMTGRLRCRELKRKMSLLKEPLAPFVLSGWISPAFALKRK